MSLIALPKSDPDIWPNVRSPVGLPPRPAFDTGTPSTTNSGLLFPRMEFAPRIVTFVDPPCVPAPVTFNPDTLPASWFMMFWSCVRFSSSWSTCCIAVPSWLFSRVMPRAVTTTPSSCVGDVASTKSFVTVPALRLIDAVTGWNPMRRAVSETCCPAPRPAGMVNV